MNGWLFLTPLVLFRYSIVVSSDYIEEHFEGTLYEMDHARRSRGLYSFLDKRREDLFGHELATTKDAVDKAETDHYRTIAFKTALSKGTDRSTSVCFLKEMNGYRCSRYAFSGTNLKRLFMEERERRTREHAASMVEAHEKVSILLEGNAKSPSQNVALFYSSNATHYDILGVSHDATTSEIKSKFESLSKAFHPDHRNHGDSAFIFRRLVEACETLSTIVARKDYDDMLATAQSA